MQIVKLHATTSTNDHLADMDRSRALEDWTVVMADHQTHGRGQGDNIWSSQPGTNVIMSVYRLIERSEYDPLDIHAYVSVAIYDYLMSYSGLEIKIKWPNDILSGNRKIAGILIQNRFKTSGFFSCIIGIGLNLNQTNFDNLPRAISLKQITGNTYHLPDERLKLLQHLMRTFSCDKATVLKRYKSNLYGYLQTREFVVDGTPITGKIIGVNAENALLVKTSEGLQHFDTQEIKWIY